MSWSAFFSVRGQRQWHTLDDLVQSALADAINADARFQLKQAEAWSQFSESIRELSDNPILQTIDLSVGFGRLENLALQEMTIDLDLEIYRASWFKRAWWGVLAVFGGSPPDIKQVFRLNRNGTNARNRIVFSIKAKRNDIGSWEVDDSALPAGVKTAQV